MKTAESTVSGRAFRVLAAAAVITAAASFAGCSGKDSGKDSKKEAKEEPKTVFAVSTIEAVRGELKDYLEFGGDVSAKTNIDVLPDAAGRVVELSVSVGSYVAKDQIVAMIDPSRPGMNYAQSPVKAPISGTVTAVNVVVGSMVSQQVPLARISKTDTLQISMNVPERFVSKIKMRQTAMLRFDAYPGEFFEAVIVEISPVLDQTSRTMGVKLAFASPDPRIKAGMFARVKLITDTRSNIVKIPEAAIVSRFGEQFVFVVDGDAVRKQPVKAGIRVDDKIEILEGLSGGDEIVVRGQTLLEDGSEVNVVSKLEPLPVMESIR